MANLNISPAISAEKISTPMSPKEFQQSLYSWFEEKGLLADLRSYLRTQMITRFRNVGKIKEEPKQFSLQKQAFNLVIAEHLLREKFHFTLSVFSTELPKNIQLPFTSSCLFIEESKQSWKFDQESVFDIMELIGIPKCTVDAQSIAAKYQSKDTSLLNCLITCKYSPINDFNNSETYNVIPGDDLNGIGDVKIYLNKILARIRVPQTIIRLLEDKLQQTYNNFDTINKRNETCIGDLKQEITKRDKEIKRLLQSEVLIQEENTDLKLANKKLKKQLNQAVLKDKMIKMKLVDGENKNQRTSTSCAMKHCNSICEANKTLMRQLDDKIQSLKGDYEEKVKDYDKLQLKYEILVKDLQTSQTKIDFLNSCLAHSNHLSGKSNFVDESVNKICFNDQSSDDMTEDILKEVRTRLQELEKESDEIDIRFKQMRISKVCN